MQAVLARLALSRAFRQLFQIQPGLALEGYQLETEERTALQSIQASELDRFATSLRKKASGHLRSYYTLSNRYLCPDRSQRILDRFLDLHPAAAHESHQEYAVRLGHFWEESLAEAEFFAADLVRYERLLLSPRLQAAGPGPRPQAGVIATSFACDLPGLLPQLGQVEPAAQDYGLGTTHYAVLRLPPQFQLFRINLPTYVLLQACNGQRQVAEITNYCEKFLQTTDLGTQIQSMLEQLCQRQLLQM